jgi:hypothetical protein
MKDTALYEQLLGLRTPWSVKKVDLSLTDQRVVVEVVLKKGQVWSDPTDVCETITRIHMSRDEAFKASTTLPPRTVLSPSGSRIGSVGMLLAALRLDLPIMYEESIGYTSELLEVPPLSEGFPDHTWHIWLGK